MVLGAVACSGGSSVTDKPCTSREPGLNTTEISAVVRRKRTARQGEMFAEGSQEMQIRR